MANVLVTSVLSLGLSVVFILCIVALVARNGYLGDEDLKNTDAVYFLCKPTEYKERCKESLKEVSKNSSSTKKDYLFATIRSIEKELRDAVAKASYARNNLNSLKLDSKYAVDDLKNCEELLDGATEELTQVLDIACKTKIETLYEQADPIIIWLTAVRSYQSTCVDEIRDEKLKKEMAKYLEKANKDTYNSEKIMYNIGDILLEFGVDLGYFDIGVTGHRRRLLDEEDAEDSPAWFSAADRTLLGGGGGGDDEDGHDGYFKKHTSQDYFKTPEPEKIKKKSAVAPDVVVAQDGTGDYNTIKDALADYPKDHKGRYVIHIRAGVYDEGQIIVNKSQYNVYMFGDGRDKTIITGDLSLEKGEVTTSKTATFVAEGERFMAKSIGFRNTIGPEGKQAVAFRSKAPHAILVDCSFEGYQGTLYYHAHDQFYKNCSISGTVDFIFGSGRAFFQDCEIHIRKPEKNQKNFITADGKMKYVEAGGVVLQKCKIKAAKDLEPEKKQVKSYLGRPWKPESTAIVMQTEITDVIQKEGWSKLEEGTNKNHKTCYFREYSNKGHSSDPDERVKWKGFKVIKDKKIAAHYTPDPFMDAKCWLPNAGVPVESGFKY